MNIDEARKLITEADALKDLRSWLGSKADNATSFPIPEAAFPFLVPLIDVRLHYIGVEFEPSPAPDPSGGPISAPKPTRPKVKLHVLAKRTQLGPDNDMSPALWEAWAKERGFKWSSVQNALRDVRKEKEAKNG